MDAVIRRLSMRDRIDAEDAVCLEWMSANGLGGYASGSVIGIPTRRFHSWLVAAMPAPIGRITTFNFLAESVRFPNREVLSLGRDSRALVEFRLEMGMPVWRYEHAGYVIEKSAVIIHMQNTVHVRYRLLEGEGVVRLQVRPFLSFRAHEGRVDQPVEHVVLQSHDARHELSVDGFPPLRLYADGERTTLTVSPKELDVDYVIERNRGYDHHGKLTSPGFLRADLKREHSFTLIGSTESWERMMALTPDEAEQAERERRERLLARVESPRRDKLLEELVLASDQFVITPRTRIEDAARAQASGDEVRTIIAGYPWFTDWGRDTMISFEGLTLSTGRHAEAAYILRTFAHYVRDGLVPNLFPEGETDGLYHTADASLWFFHAVSRYVEVTRNDTILAQLLPTLCAIADAHLVGTHFGIHVDKNDGLLVQGQVGYQLTWMDAKVDGWVVTPRRGKAVEINALYYNALSCLADWLERAGDRARAKVYSDAATRARESFNKRFWNDATGCLYDVVDGEGGNDPACRPNQLFAVSLPHAVLDQERWTQVLDTCERLLLTPFGLRTLAPNDPSYKSRYFGDLRSRDAAYHQGTVWTWLLGAFVDAWLKVHPRDVDGRLHEAISVFERHLSEACVGQVSEIFDAEPPFAPRGCFAQAWSVAELLRVRLLLTRAGRAS